MTSKNTFFKLETYQNDIDLETNEGVIESMYEDNICETDKLKINFAFVTDTKEKADYFSIKIKSTYKEYSNINVKPYEELFEIIGETNELQMTIEKINQWNQKMWDFGYLYDCKLDGWYVGKD